MATMTAADSSLDDNASGPTPADRIRSPRPVTPITSTTAGTTTSSDAEKTTQVSSGEVQRLRDEFAVNLHKFQTVLAETESAVHGVFQLPQPDFSLPTLDQCLSGLPYEVYEPFKSLIESWSEFNNFTFNICTI